MSIQEQPKDQINYYIRLLKAVASLSNLFSDSSKPLISPRATENIFCKVFEAQNLSRSDAAVDASKNKIGYGIKTFIDTNGRSMQKVAEFNNDHSVFSSLKPREKIIKISQLRNERFETTRRIFGLDNIIYHCITRRKGEIIVYETPAHLIDVKKIKNIKVSKNGNSISFSDPSSDYSFNLTKSTLYKRFITKNILLKIPVKILEDPFSLIEKLIEKNGLIFSTIKIQPHVFLPLYSMRGGKNVPERSGLNQWNAGGRTRKINEVYIPIPAWIHKKFPRFFPERDKVFALILPDRTSLSASVCQDGSKALMSNPNTILGKWILRDVLNLKEGELVTYEKLKTIGLDTVVVYKIDNKHYDIDFSRIGSYEDFLVENNKISSSEESINSSIEE